MLIECEMSTADVDYIIIPTQTDLLDNCHQLIHHFFKENVFTNCSKKTNVSLSFSISNGSIVCN